MDESAVMEPTMSHPYLEQPDAMLLLPQLEMIAYNQCRENFIKRCINNLLRPIMLFVD